MGHFWVKGEVKRFPIQSIKGINFPQWRQTAFVSNHCGHCLRGKHRQNARTHTHTHLATSNVKCWVSDEQDPFSRSGRTQSTALNLPLGWWWATLWSDLSYSGRLPMGCNAIFGLFSTEHHTGLSISDVRRGMSASLSVQISIFPFQ